MRKFARRFIIALALAIFGFCIFPLNACAGLDPNMVKWAEGGNANAQSNIGESYMFGSGVAKDYAEAAKWFIKSAEGGNKWSGCDLVRIYWSGGFGLEKDLGEAYFWSYICGAEGNELRARAEQNNLVTPGQKAAANLRWKIWTQGHPPATIPTACVSNNADPHDYDLCMDRQQKLAYQKSVTDRQATSAAPPPAPPFATAPNAASKPVITAMPAAENMNYRGVTWLEKVATYTVSARVLNVESFHDYLRKESVLDTAEAGLVLGWGRMADAAVTNTLLTSQHGRGYHWSFQQLPIPSDEVDASIAHVLLVPASGDIRDAIGRLQKGQLVTLAGHLVHIHDAYYWKTALTPQDVKQGYCWYLYVEALTPQNENGQ